MLAELIPPEISSYLAANQFLTGGALLGTLGAGLAYGRQFPGWVWSQIKRYSFHTIQIDSSDPSYFALANCTKDLDLHDWFRNFEMFYDRTNRIVKLRPNSDSRFLKFFDEWCYFSATKEKMEGSGSRSSQTWIRGHRYDLKPDTYIDRYSLTFFTRKSYSRVKGKIESLHDYFPLEEKEVDEICVATSTPDGWDYNYIKPRKIESVFLDEKADQILKFIKDFDESEEWYERCGVPYRTGMLLYGPPGNGKSSIVSALAGTLKKRLYVVKLQSVTSDAILEGLINNCSRGGLIVFEDVDCMKGAAKRISETSQGQEEKKEEFVGVTLSGLLNVLDGISAQQGNVVVMTTNHPEKLDPALVRPGRVDLAVKIENASKSQMKNMFSKFFPGKELLAEKFAESNPDGKYAMCQIQNHLMYHRHNPELAATADVGTINERNFSDL